MAKKATVKETVQPTEIVQPKVEAKLKGTVVHSPSILNGKRVSLVRGGQVVHGVIMSNSGQFSTHELVFKWKDLNGNANVSPVTGEEMESLLKNK